MADPRLFELIEANDLDGLIRFVDGLSEARDWQGMLDVRRFCTEAGERGKQLWAAAQFAEYRLALEAPGPTAASVLEDGAGRFALGPLWEVAASTHPWAELEGHVPSPRMAAMAAHERVVRGEDLTEADVDPHVVDLSLRLEPWEPAYPVAVYRADKADFPEPDLPPLREVELGEAAGTRTDTEAHDALVDLVRPWTEQSNGRAEAVAVTGDAAGAVRALGPSRVQMAELAPAPAFALLTWTGASGGAYGRRRGTPVGRSLAWWTVSVLAGLTADWPVPGERIGEAAAALRWYRWRPGDEGPGWSFHIAVEDPGRGRAWAITAVDAR